ncbi:STAS domain-containing protein [Streptomyces sp. NPDC059176]|uniref:STAS domain-containing protein n=1 Tax=unclassified Streptomyces TaxID=2593676 RepID=UPI003681875C
MIPSSSFQLSSEVVDGTVAVRVAGDLDHDTSDELVGLVEVLLLGEPRPTAVRIDFGRLGTLDSMGLAALLMVRRLTRTAGVAVFLDQRPPTSTASSTSRERWTT